MDALPLVRRLGPEPLESPHATLHLVRPAAPLPPGCDVAVLLPDLSRAAYVPRAPGEGARVEVAPDPFVRGNSFRPLHESPRSLAALVSVAAGRTMTSGPESERVLVFVRGSGLVFLQNGDALKFGPMDAALLPAGEPARVWAQGPEDALAVALQPRMDAEPRRTLAGEVARLKAAAGAGTRGGPSPTS